MERKIYFSADDFGISKLANVNILKVLRRGKLDRVAVMISENLSPDEVNELKESGAKLDIHLHLVPKGSDYWRGNRLMRESAAKRLVLFLMNYMTGKFGTQKVALQWTVQIEQFREIFGKNPDGIGSHEYIHYFPPYLKETAKLAHKYEIPFFRFGLSDSQSHSFVSRAINYLRKYGKEHVIASDLTTTDHMESFDWYDNLLFLDKLPPNSSAEVVFHPEREEEMTFLENLKRSSYKG
jgi:predicted glycoside hydrolase/deacetylase ChbG (UPF0249 family)